MKAFIHVCKKDEELFNKWLEHTKSLELPDLIVWAEPDVNINYKIDRIYKSEYGYPKVCSDVWLTAISTINEPVLYLEPDAWPLIPNWFSKLKQEYKELGEPASMVTNDCYPPYDLVGGIGVYDWNKLPHLTIDEIHSEIPEWACFDTWIGNLPDDLKKKSKLIRHSYGVYVDDEFVDHHIIDTEDKFLKLTSGGAIFHKDKYGLIANWIKT
jgi:hypothetical protein